MSNLVGVSEAAAILGWSRGKVSVYNGRGLLPKPVTRLTTGPVWRREDIVAWSVRWLLGIEDPVAERQRIVTTYGLHAEAPIGAQLHAQGILSEEQGEWLDREVSG